MLPPLTLVLGGISSGKSAYAEAVTMAQGDSWLYIATMPPHPDDAEVQEKIALHRARRSAAWHTVDAPLNLARAIRDARKPVLVDCLTLWLSNLMEAERDISAATAEFCEALAAREAPVICVSNEVGLGGVPGHPLARSFARAQGSLNQTVAQTADHVVFVAAGLPLALRGALPI